MNRPLPNAIYKINFAQYNPCRLAVLSHQEPKKISTTGISIPYNIFKHVPGYFTIHKTVLDLQSITHYSYNIWHRC